MVRLSTKTFALSALCLLSVVLGSSPKGPWDKFNYAPSSRTVWPTAIHSSNGNVQNAAKLVQNAGSATLTGNGSWVALDFGVEVSY
jgi:hypothetical protein